MMMIRQQWGSSATAGALLLLVGLPVAMIVLQAVFPQWHQGSFTQAFQGLARQLAQPQVWGLAGDTLALGLTVAAISAAIGIPLGAARALFALPGARLWDLLFLIPFLLPPYICALSWTLALQSRGYVHQVLGWDGSAWLFSPWGVALVMSLNTFPVVYFAVSRSMAGGGRYLGRVARVCGASPAQAFARVILPLALPAILASLLLAFTLSIEEYGVPAALGTQAGLSVLTVAIERRLSDWPVDLSGAAMLSLILMLLALTVYAVQRAMLAGRQFETQLGRPVASVPASLGLWRWPVLLVFALTALSAVGVPLAALLLGALSRTVSGGVAWGNLGLDHFRTLLQGGDGALQSLGSSMGLALATACLTALLGVAAACHAQDARTRLAGFLDGLSLMPAAIPGIVVGVGLILAWNQAFWPLTPYGTLFILVLSYSCLLLPYPVRYAGAALRQMSPSLAAAARVHGASGMQAFWRITLPQIWPSVLAAMLMVFAVSSRELVTSLLLAPAGVSTVSIYIWRQFEQGSIGQGMAMACVAMAASLGLMLAALRLQRRAG